MNTLQLDHILIEWQLIKRKRKSIAFQFMKTGELRVMAPYSVTKREIQDMMIKNKKKILELYNRHQEIQVTKPAYKEGDIFYYMGEALPLVIREQSGLQRVGVTKEAIEVYVHHATQDGVKAVLEEWYKEESRRLVLHYIDVYKNSIAHTFGHVRIKNQKSRWGSCSSKGNLNFNLRLAMMPNDAIAYVVLHEMCHLLELNHSQAFWRHVVTRMPNYMRYKRWIKDNGAYLMQYFS